MITSDEILQALGLAGATTLASGGIFGAGGLKDGFNAYRNQPGTLNLAKGTVDKTPLRRFLMTHGGKGIGTGLKVGGAGGLAGAGLGLLMNELLQAGE